MTARSERAHEIGNGHEQRILAGGDQRIGQVHRPGNVEDEDTGKPTPEHSDVGLHGQGSECPCRGKIGCEVGQQHQACEKHHQDAVVEPAAQGADRHHHEQRGGHRADAAVIGECFAAPAQFGYAENWGDHIDHTHARRDEPDASHKQRGAPLCQPAQHFPQNGQEFGVRARQTFR